MQRTAHTLFSLNHFLKLSTLTLDIRCHSRSPCTVCVEPPGRVLSCCPAPLVPCAQLAPQVVLAVPAGAAGVSGLGLQFPVPGPDDSFCFPVTTQPRWLSRGPRGAHTTPCAASQSVHWLRRASRSSVCGRQTVGLPCVGFCSLPRTHFIPFPPSSATLTVFVGQRARWGAFRLGGLKCGAWQLLFLNENHSRYSSFFPFHVQMRSFQMDARRLPELERRRGRRGRGRLWL